MIFKEVYLIRAWCNQASTLPKPWVFHVQCSRQKHSPTPLWAASQGCSFAGLRVGGGLGGLAGLAKGKGVWLGWLPDGLVAKGKAAKGKVVMTVVAGGNGGGGWWR